MMLIGEPYWRVTPSDEKTAVACHATSVADFLPLPELIEQFGELGYDVVQMMLSDQQVWDRYTAAQWLTVRRWLDENPKDELAPQVRAELTAEPARYTRYLREYLGWGRLRADAAPTPTSRAGARTVHCPSPPARLIVLIQPTPQSGIDLYRYPAATPTLWTCSESPPSSAEARLSGSGLSEDRCLTLVGRRVIRPVGRLVLGRRNVVDLAMQAAMIEPVDVLGDRPLDVSHAPPAPRVDASQGCRCTRP